MTKKHGQVRSACNGSNTNLSVKRVWSESKHFLLAIKLRYVFQIQRTSWWWKYAPNEKYYTVMKVCRYIASKLASNNVRMLNNNKGFIDMCRIIV